MGQTRQWVLDEFELNNINLIVGKNSDGKSRTVSVINGLSTIITSPVLNINNGSYVACFENNNDIIVYELVIFNGSITNEKLTINNKILLTRAPDGAGEMWNEEAGKRLKFKIAFNTPAISKRDEMQYPYLQQLYDWALNTYLFLFNTDLGKNNLLMYDHNQPLKVNLKETNKVVELFIEGVTKYRNQFKQKIIESFNLIGYNIKDIGYGTPQDIRFEGNLPGRLSVVYVQENDRQAPTEQFAMSMGMFRALAIIIYFSYYEVSNLPGTVLIDDIGEGLDFDRSSKLIQLLIDKCSKNKIQLVMTTNDRFVMNNVPLEYWQIISRQGGKVKMFNKQNSEDTFKDFEFTGLNNFDFFSTGFFKEGFDSDATFTE